MVDILLFWAAEGVDGFRCDMAEMVPTAFWSYASQRLKAAHPEAILIGEVYNPALYRAYIASGFAKPITAMTGSRRKSIGITVGAGASDRAEDRQ